jgi:SagB-type dehydrogenase family enzyme
VIRRRLFTVDGAETVVSRRGFVGRLIRLGVLAALPVVTGARKGRAMQTIDLPDVRREGRMAVESALAQRRSVRTFADRPLDRNRLGQVLWAAQGITGPRGRMRSAPSAGARYPLEVYVIAGSVEGVAAGIYRYRPRGHQLVMVTPGDLRRDVARAALGQGWMTRAPATVAISGVVSRTAAKYGPRAERYVYMEAGHAAQNIYLQAQAEGLGTTAVGAFRDEALHALVAMDPGEIPLYLLPVGWPR